MSSDAKILTTNEAARYLRLSASTLQHYRLRGEGPPFSRLGKLVRYRREMLDAWVEERQNTTTTEETQT